MLIKLTVEELMASNRHINYDVAIKVKKYILNKYYSTYRDKDFSEFVLICLDAIKRDEASYDETKGVLFSYLTTSINGALLTKYAQTVSMRDLLEHQEYEQVEADLTIYNNREVLAMYNVVANNATNEDLRIVKGLKGRKPNERSDKVKKDGAERLPI